MNAFDELTHDPEARYQAVIETAVDAILVIDSDGEIQSANPACRRMLGWEPEELVGRNISQLMPTPHSDAHDSYVRRYLHTGEKRIIGLGREVETRHKDGHLIPTWLSVGEIVEGDRRLFTGILRDLTESRQLQQALVQEQALARLGQLSAFVAHEVKNPLAAVSQVLQVLRGRLTDRPDDQLLLGDVLARIASLDDMVTDMLTYARPRSPQPRPVPIGLVIESAVKAVGDDPAHRRIQVSVTGAQELRALLDIELFRPVLVNALLNSGQAMEGEGRIEIQVGSAARTCVIEVTDEGPGIPDTRREQAFEPFFTTKPRGTGLGLAICRRHVEALEGTIHFSGPNTLEIRLPLA